MTMRSLVPGTDRHGKDRRGDNGAGSQGTNGPFTPDLLALLLRKRSIDDVVAGDRDHRRRQEEFVPLSISALDPSKRLFRGSRRAECGTNC